MPLPAETVVLPAKATKTSAQRPGPGRWSALYARGLLAAIAIVCIVDWVRPLQGRLSYALSFALTCLAIPWGVFIFRSEGFDSEPARAVDRSRLLRARSRSRVFHESLVVLTALFLAAKWNVLLSYGANSQEFIGSSRSYTLALVVLMTLGVFARGLRVGRFVSAAADHPARLMALSFFITGLLGALLLSLPVSVERVSTVSLVDNIFMAFSAVCVTGLSVNNVAETYTTFGQVVLCALIQVGGLGIMVLSAAIAILSGQRLRVKSSVVLAEMVDLASLASLRRSVLMILFYTLLIEGIAASLLYTRFVQHPASALRYGEGLAGPGNPVWAAVFHAVSAFCNAGFSNFQAGLVPLVTDPIVIAVVSTSIVVGGIGFPVLDELGRTLLTKLRRKRAQRLSLHSRLALRMTAGLLAFTTCAYLILEWTHCLAGVPLWSRFGAAAFQAASARTAGFNVVDVAAMMPATLVLTCALMFIGACPGSTGGGIKTTTAAVLFSGLRSELSGTPARLLDRAIPEGVVTKAIGVAVLSGMIVVVGFFLLLLTESLPPLDLAFEVVSAFSTTGLSTGITPKLSVAGKLLIATMMFIGRIGPLTLALLVAVNARHRALELPQERVAIG